MKINILLLYLVTFIPLAYGQDTCTIEGNILNMPDSVSVSLSVKEGNAFKILDSDYAMMLNGKFRITRQVDKTTCMSFSSYHSENTSSGLDVWTKPGANIKIVGNNTDPMSWNVESNVPEQQECNRFRDANRNEFVEMSQISKEWMKFLRKVKKGEPGAKAQFDSVKLIVNGIEKRITQNDLIVLQQNPIGIVGLQQLEKACKWLRAGKFDDREQIVSVYNRLTDEQKQSDIGKAITSSLFSLPTVQVGEALADGELKDLDGNIHHLSDFKGKYILLDFWSQACAPCVKALPELKKITMLYKDKVTVISLSVDTEKLWRESSKDRDIIWLNLSDNLGTNGIAARYKVFGLPGYVLISPEGIVQDRWDGYSDNSLIVKLNNMIK